MLHVSTALDQTETELTFSEVSRRLLRRTLMVSRGSGKEHSEGPRRDNFESFELSAQLLRNRCREKEDPRSGLSCFGREWS